MSQTIAVVGAGIAGLTAAHRLKKAGLHPVIFESSDRPGGRMHSVRRGDFIFDLGTVAPIGGNPLLPELVAAAGLNEQFSQVDTMTIGIVRDGRMRRIDTAHALRDLVATDLLPLSAKLGLVKLAVHVFRQRKILTTDNAIGLGALDRQTIAEYAAGNFDADTLNYLFSPVMRGMNFTSAKDHRAVQLLWTLRQMAYPLHTLSGGNGSLPVALAAQHEVRYHHAVEQVKETARGVEVSYMENGRLSSEQFDACVIAATAPSSLALFPGMSGAQRRFFEAIHFSSVLCVHFGLSNRPANPELLLMFPECEDNDVAAVYLNHNKAPGRAPPNKGSLSFYFTQEWSADKMDWPDEKLIDLALARMAPYYGDIKPLIECALVSRWPQFVMDPTPGLFALMDEYQRSLIAAVPSRVQIAGDFLPCGGVNQAIASGAEAAGRIGAALGHN